MQKKNNNNNKISEHFYYFLQYGETLCFMKKILRPIGKKFICYSKQTFE